MKSAKYMTLFLALFNLATLLANIAAAYPALRLGAVFTLLALGVFCVLALGIGGLFTAMRGRGGYLERNSASLALTPALGVLIGLVLAIVFGVYTGT